MHQALNIAPKDLEAFCRRHHMIRLSLFGSQLKGSATEQSDVDLLVEFDPAHIPSLLDIAAMEDELSQQIGKRVDLRTAGDLSKYFREDVVDTAEVQYAQGR